MDIVDPWTWRQFHDAMKLAGWVRMTPSDPAKTYIHSRSKRKFYPYHFAAENGVVDWVIWAQARQTPPPF